MVMRSMGRTGEMLAIAMAVAALPSAAMAHHSFAAFDMTQTKTVTGTVADFQWTNPHTFIWLNVPAANGTTEKWGVEGMSPNFLERRGWDKHTLQVGDKVSVVVHPTKTGDGGSFLSITLPNGKVMSMMGGSE